MTGTKPRRDLVHLLSRAEHFAVRRLAAALEDEYAGCTIEQWRVLNLLADGSGHTMTEVADYALLPAPTTTKLVDRLVADTLVYRHPDPTDRRRVLVHIADRGRELHGRLASTVDRVQSDVLRELGDEAEFEAVMDRLADAFDPTASRSV